MDTQMLVQRQISLNLNKTQFYVHLHNPFVGRNEKIFVTDKSIKWNFTYYSGNQSKGLSISKKIGLYVPILLRVGLSRKYFEIFDWESQCVLRESSKNTQGVIQKYLGSHPKILNNFKQQPEFFYQTAVIQFCMKFHKHIFFDSKLWTPTCLFLQHVQQVNFLTSPECRFAKRMKEIEMILKSQSLAKKILQAMQTQRITQNLTEAREDNYLSFINFDNSKDQNTQLQGLSYTLSPTKFSLLKVNQPIQKHDNERSKAVPWSNLQQLYYFDSVLRFIIEHPYLTVSWAEWKPPQFYNCIAQKMTQIFGSGGRNSTQIKTKDQNLKKQYYNKSSRKIDIVKVALEKLIFFVNKSIKRQSKPEQIKTATQRCKETLRNYQEKLSQMKQPKKYQIQLARLIRFIKTTDSQVCKIQLQEPLMISVESMEMNSPILFSHS